MFRLPARAASVSAVLLSALVLAACSDVTGPNSDQQGPLFAPRKLENVRTASLVLERNRDRLRSVRGVVGTAVGLLPNGEAAIQVMVLDDGPRDIPATIDNIPVQVRVTGWLMARSDPTLRLRPAPVGFSIGHPAITAGTIGARVFDASGVYALSNNHVLANSNDATIGDAALQPGPFDGGTGADQIGTLVAFKPLDFNGGDNTIDAAIARSDALSLGNSTPTDDGYGLPNGRIFGDANGDRLFDDRNALLGLNVQKYGRTTKLTRGTITGINASVDICYEILYIFCIKAAHFVDQLVVTPAGFSDGGDSGSLIVTDNGDKNPVGLLFAGSATETIANRIDFVLNHFNVSVDGIESEPPAIVTDVAMQSVTAPAAVTQGATVTVSMVVKNVGNQRVGTFSVILRDETDNVAFPPKFVSALNPGASSIPLNVTWNTTSSSVGPHTLVATSQLVDDNPENNSGSATTTVNEFIPTVEIHVGDVDGTASPVNASTWSARVEITVHDGNHIPLNGAVVTGNWSRLGPNTNTCTTGELGGNGTCVVLFPSISRTYPNIIYAVSSVTLAGRLYRQALNHDPDGSGNGNSQKLLRP